MTPLGGLHHPRRTRAISAATLIVVAAACSSTAAPETSSSTLATTTIIAASAPTSSPPPHGGVDVLALPVALDGAAPGWEEILFLPYGPTPAGLGTSPGGDSGMIDLGPEYGAQDPDGTWWILDIARLRIARFGPTGSFLDDFSLPDEVLVNGQYVQFQLGRLMADGTYVAFEHGEQVTSIIRITATGADRTLVANNFFPVGDDGHTVYAFTVGGRAVAIDPTAGEVHTTEWFLTQAGTRYRLRSDGYSALRIELPDAGIDRTLPIVAAADPSVAAFGAWQAATTADGRIHLFLWGFPLDDDSIQLAGYTTILPDGTVTPVVEVRNPFTAADPGSPAHLGAAFGADEPWLMIIDTDGVRIYRPA